MIELNKIHCGDCLDLMKGIPDKTIDLVFYDPPYNIGKDYGEFKDNLPLEVYVKWMEDVINESNRISKRGIIIYVGGKLTHLFSKLLPESHLIIIEKRAAGVFSGNYMLQYHSMFSNAPPLIKCKDLWDDVRLPGEGYFFNEERFDHPGQTGLEFTKKVLQYFSNEGETIFDPFMGIGTTAVACKKSNRNFIGIEISPEYCAIAEKRLESVNNHKLSDFSTLF